MAALFAAMLGPCPLFGCRTACAPRLRRWQPCWLEQRSTLPHKAQHWRLGCVVCSHAWTLPCIRLSNSFTSARGSRAIRTYRRPTSFSRANGTVGVGALAATPGRAGDNDFPIFLPIPADSAQNCARKHVGWRRQHPPRPGVAVGFRLLGRFHRLLKGCHEGAARLTKLSCG